MSLRFAKTNSKSRSVEFVDVGTELKRGSACVTLSHSMRESHSRTPPEPHSNPVLLASPFPPSHRAGLLGAGLSAHLSPLNPFPRSSGDGSMIWPSGQTSDCRSLTSELTFGEPVDAIYLPAIAIYLLVARDCGTAIAFCWLVIAIAMFVECDCSLAIC